MPPKIRIDSKGMRELLLSLRAEVRAAADAVASNVDARGKPVEVRAYTTDRAAASVSIAHPAGLAIQAKYGALTKAAAAAGLEVGSADSSSDLIEYTTKSGKKRMATRAQVANWTRG